MFILGWPELRCDPVALLLNRLHAYLALQEITITTNNFSLVEGLVLVHLLLHEVLHDAGVEVSALLLVRCVHLFGVVHQEFRACFLEWLVSARSYSCRSAYLRLITI